MNYINLLYDNVYFVRKKTMCTFVRKVKIDIRTAKNPHQKTPTAIFG
jgi:hypothetical protein